MLNQINIQIKVNIEVYWKKRKNNSNEYIIFSYQEEKEKVDLN